MATLNMRISKARNASNEFRKRTPNLLSDDFLKTVEKCIGTDFHNSSTLSEELRAASTLDAQVNALKQKVEDELRVENGVQIPHALRYLVVVYLNVPPKSPLKGRFLKILKVWIDKDEDTHLQNYLLKHFHEVVSAVVSSGRLISSPGLKNIVSMLEYFEKYPSLLRRSYASIMQYVKTLLTCDVRNGIFIEASSLSRLFLYECIHDGVRALLLMMHSVGVSNDDEIISEVLHDKEFLSVIDSFIHHSELPLDSKLNCGLLSMRIMYKTEGATQCVKIFHEKCLADQNRDSLAKICYCSPLLNIFTIQDLNSLKVCESDVTDDSVFQLLYQFLFKMSDYFATDSNIILALNRTIEQLAICLSDKSSVHVTAELAQLFLNYILAHSDHYMDAVKHRTKSIFEHFITFGELPCGVDVVHLVLESMSEVKMTSKFFCVGIQLLSTHVNTDVLLDRFPKFIDTYIQAVEETPASANLVSAFTQIMFEQSKRRSVDEWVSRWVNPILEAINQTDSPALEQILERSMQIAPQILNIILKREELPFYVRLICIYLGKKNGLDINELGRSSPGTVTGPQESPSDIAQIRSNITTWNNVLKELLMKGGREHPNEKIRLLAFQLVTELDITPNFMNFFEFDYVLVSLQDNLSIQSPSFRQKSLSHLKKFLQRHKECLSKKNCPREYSMFSQSLLQICADNLFPSANFGRRCYILNILKIVFDLKLFKDLQDQITLEKGLLLHLNDTFEENKATALYLLTFKIFETIGLKGNIFEGTLSDFEPFQICKELASSTHPSDCVTAAYFLEFFIRTDEVILLDSSSIQAETEAPDCWSEAKLYFLELERMLENQVQIAENNILEAAVHGPIYGVLHIIKHLMSRLDLQFIDDGEFWVPYLSRVIELSFRASSAVSKIVNNLSPEGHLPMDFTVVNHSGEAGTSQAVVSHATSQLLLLCAWRTTKAVSLFFAETMERIPIIKEGDHGLMTKTMVLRIGSYFMQSLSEIKHRGAFEQAYIGFSKICLVLWKCPIIELSKLTEQWLEEMMTEITTASDRLCSTRRSAGVPFIIQALLVAEHQLSPSSSCFHSAMQRLLDLCKVEGAPSESKIHALNILRSLFRSTELGDQVNTYVAQAVKIAVLGFSSSSWSERNSSTLLLSALLVRIFGVPRSKDKLTWKNKMTGRIFFLRYPSLYEFFLQQLQDFDANTANLEITNTDELRIFPILLVLARIYPSSLEGTDSNLQFTNYLKYVRSMSKSRIHDVRVLAANAIASFLTISNWQENFECLFNELQSTEFDNVRHGILLQLSQIVLKLTEISEKTEKYLTDKIEALLPILLSASVSFVVKDTFLKFVFYATSKSNYRMQNSVLTYLCSQIAIKCQHGNIIGKNNFDITATLFVLFNGIVHEGPCEKETDNVLTNFSKLTLEEISSLPSPISFLDYVLFFMKSSEFDVFDTVFNFIFYLLLLFNDLNVEFKLLKHEQEDLNAFLTINHGTKFFHQVFSVLKETQQSQLESVKKDIINSKEFCEQLIIGLETALVKDKNHLILQKYLAVLRFVPCALRKYCNSCEPVLANLTKLCFNDHDDSISVQALHCISSYLEYEKRAEKEKENRQKSFSREDKELLANLIFSQERVSCHSDQIRFALAQIIDSHFSLILQLYSEVTTIKLMFGMVDLVTDDLAPIREIFEKRYYRGLVNINDHQFLAAMFTQFKSSSDFGNFNFALACVAWMVKDVDYTAADEKQEKVFNKTDSNAYQEDIMLAKIAWGHLDVILSRRHRLEKVPIPEPVIDLLWSYCNLTMEKCFTIFDIFNAVTEKYSLKINTDIYLYVSTVLRSNLTRSNDFKKLLSNAKMTLIKLLFQKLSAREKGIEEGKGMNHFLRF